jgi:hypothetical protein
MGTEQQQSTGEAEQQQEQTGQPDVREQRRQAESTENSEEQKMTEKPEVTDEHKEEAKKIAKAYNDDLQTTTLPGSGGTVAGTAVTEWVDDKDKGNIETTAEEGNVEYRNTEAFRKIQES